jgi:hypothetical protein
VDTLMHHLTGFGKDANLTLLFVHIDANMLHGWSPLCAALTALLPVELYATMAD